MNNYQQVQTLDNYQCPGCKSDKLPICSLETGWATIILFFISIPFFGILNFFLLPFIIEGSKSTVKRCQECKVEIERIDLFSLNFYQYFSIQSLTDEVFKLTCGSCMIVISRKYVIVLVLIFTIFQLTKYQQQNIEIKQISWESLIEDCGREVFLNNELHANHQFNQHYQDKFVNWTGIYMEQQDYYDIMLNMDSYMIFVKMNPTDSNKEDIHILAPQLDFQDQKPLLDELKKYDEIWFYGKLINIGNDYDSHQLILYEFKKTGKSIDLDQIKTYKSKKRQSLRKKD